VIEWTRAHRDRICGRCGGPIPTGAPLEAHRLIRSARVLVRCVLCAHTSPPLDVPARPPPELAPVRWTPPASRRSVDVRARQTKDD
jgi:hypothetical protein